MKFLTWPRANLFCYHLKNSYSIHMNTYDIFLVPTASQTIEYNQLIATLANDYKTPSFLHVTILEKVEANEQELIAKVASLAQDFNEIEVDLFGVNFTNTTHQCVFAQIKMSAPLLTLYEGLAANLQFSNKAPFFPHMSLIYGDFSPEAKATIAGQVKVGNRLLLDKLIIYRDGPLATDWQQVAEFELK